MLNTQKKAIPVEEIFGYSSKSDKRKKKRHESSESEESSDSDSEYYGIAFSRSSKAKKIFSEDEIDGPPQCKKCFAVIEKPNRKTMMEAYSQCVKKRLCKHCYNRPVSSAYEGISQSVQQRLNYSQVKKPLVPVEDPRARLAEISAVSLTPSRTSTPVKKLIFTIGVATIRGVTRKCLFVNGIHFNKPIRLHYDVTYAVTVDTDDEPFILTMSINGGPNAVKLESTPDPMTAGNYSLSFSSAFPRRFYYQSIKTENLGGSIIVDGN